MKKLFKGDRHYIRKVQQELSENSEKLRSHSKRVRFYPKDTDETFDGTVIEETEYSYLVIPDDNLMGTSRWNKNYCDIINKKQ